MLFKIALTFHQTASNSKHHSAAIYATGLLAFPLSIAMLFTTYSRLKLMGFEFPLATVLGLEGFLYLCAVIPALLKTRFEKGFWHFLIILPLTLYTIAIFMNPARKFIKEISPHLNTYDIVADQNKKNALLKIDPQYNNAVNKISEYENKILTAQTALAPYKPILEKYRKNNFAPDSNSKAAFMAASKYEPEITAFTEEKNKYENQKKERIQKYTVTTQDQLSTKTDWIKISDLAMDYFGKDVFLIFSAIFTALLLYWFFKLLLATPPATNFSHSLKLVPNDNNRNDSLLAETGETPKNDI